MIYIVEDLKEPGCPWTYWSKESMMAAVESGDLPDEARVMIIGQPKWTHKIKKPMAANLVKL